MPRRRSTRSKRPSSQALEASPPRTRRRRTGYDSDPAPPSSIPSGPSPATSEPPVPETRPTFPPALFDQLVQRVAAEVIRQLQPASSSLAVQEPQGPSPGSAAFPHSASTSVVSEPTTEVPVVSSSAVHRVPVGNPSAVDQTTQVVQSGRSPLAVFNFSYVTVTKKGS